jgi:hypothetical protein
MADTKKVTIELTETQKSKIQRETGRVVDMLTFDPLEDRVAPSVIKPGMKVVDPSVDR